MKSNTLLPISYAIVCSPRSGSYHLAELLKSTGRCGKPAEFFNSDLTFNVCNKYSKSYTDCLKTYYSTDNGVFGVKVANAVQLGNMIASEIPITHWIWLRREDKVLQAISLYKAWFTGQWRRKHKMEIPYNHVKINKFYLELVEEDKLQKRYFEIQGVTPLEIWYDKDLTTSPEGTVVSIIDFLGIDGTNLPPVTSPEKVIRDGVSHRWKKEFIKRQTKNGEKV